MDKITSAETVVINGDDGSYWFNTIGKKAKGLIMKEFGDSVGLCMHFQTADEIADELADAELEKNPKKKKDKVAEDFRKQLGPEEQLRVLIFKDGLCVNSVE